MTAPAAVGRLVRGAARVERGLRTTAVGGSLLRFRSIHGRDRALALAGQCFTAVIPLLIVLSAFGAGDEALVRRLDRRFRLSGTAEEAMEVLFSRPPGATGAITVTGIVVLLFSTLSFTRALQKAWEAAWELPPAGVRGSLHALSGFGLLMAQVVVLALLTNAVRGWPGGNLLAVAVHILVATVLWHQLQYLLLSRRVPRAALVPGAVVAGIAQVAASLYSALYIPRLMAVNAARYGVIGVTFAMLTWFIVIAFGMVLVAAFSAELGRRRLGEARPPLPDEAARATAAPPWDVRA